MARALAKSGLMYMTIGFLPIAANLLIAPVFTRYLSQEEYGILSLTAVVQAYLSIALDLGLAGAFSRTYFSYYRKPVLIHSLFTTSVLCIFFISVIAGILFFLSGERLFAFFFVHSGDFPFQQYGWVIWSTGLLVLIQTITLALYRNSENIKSYAVISIASFLLMTAGSVSAVVIFHKGAYGSLIGKLAGLAGVMVSYLVVYFYTHPPKIKWRLVRQMLDFALPLVPYALLGLVMDNMDKQFAEHYLGLKGLGFYNVAFLISSVPAIFLLAAQSTVNPQIYRLLEEHKIKKEDAQIAGIKSLMEGLLLFMALVIVAMVAFINPISQLLLGKDFKEVSIYVPWLALAFIPRALYVVISIPVFFEKKSLWLPVINAVTVVLSVLAGFYIVPHYGLMGVCMLVILNKVIQLAVTLAVVNKLNWLNRGIFSLRNTYLLLLVLAMAIAFSQWLIVSFGDHHRTLINLIAMTAMVIVFVFLIRKKVLIYLRVLKS